MLHPKSALFLRLAFAAALVTLAMPLASSLSIAPLRAQSAAPSFALPDSVARDTTVKLIDSTPRTASISQALKQAFVAKFAGTQVTSSTAPAAIALQSVLDGKADLAALARPLTVEERSQGLVAVPIAREKIAIVVNVASPFKGNLSLKQFADIFRGQVTDWSQIGGAAGAIRVVDRPDSSDLRQSFRNYSAFNIGTLQTGGNATRLTEDSTAAVANALGNDGIGYAPLSQIRTLASVRALALHNTLPDNPKYPFSQPYLYVFKGPNPNPSAAAFLGWATAPGGQQLANTVLAGGNAAPLRSAPPPAAGSAKTAPPAGKVPTGKVPAAQAGAPAAGGKAPKPAGKANNPTLLPSQSPDLSDRDGPGARWGGLGWLWEWLPLLMLPLIWWIFRGMWSGDDQDRLGINLRDPQLAPGHGDRDGETAGLPVPDWQGADQDASGLNAPDWSASDLSAADLSAPDSSVPPSHPETFDPARPDPVDPDAAGTVAPSLWQKATGALSSLSNTVTGAGGAAIAGGTAAAGIGAAAWSHATDAPPSGTPLDLGDHSRVVEDEVAAGATWASDRDLPAYDAPDPGMDFDPLDWTNFPDATVADLGGGATGAPVAGTAAWPSWNDDRAVAVAESAVVESAVVESAVVESAVDPNAVGVIDPDAMVNIYHTDPLPESASAPYIALMPRGPHWAYASWSIPEEQKQVLKQQGGRDLALRLYDVTNIDLAVTPAHSMQQFDCGDLAQDWHIPVPISDRDYLVELGYPTSDQRWLMLARSTHIHVSTH